jgi:hypothetical protein
MASRCRSRRRGRCRRRTDHWLLRTFPSATFDVSDGGDSAAARLQLTFTSRSSGRSQTIPSIEFYETTDAKVSTIDVYDKSSHAVAEHAAG